MAVEQIELEVDLTDTATPFRHYYEMCVGSGHAALALRADWQAQLRKCREELGFRYVRFHGLLDDDMSIVLGTPERPAYHFHNVDLIYDFLLGIGMRPLVELSFMPSVIASGSQTAFHYGGNVTPPRDFARWEELICVLVRHLADRYGRREVARWLFEVWNEPNLPYFWAGTQGDYFELYRRTAAAIKSVDMHFRVGGPATARDDWVPEMIEFCRGNDVPLDFISTHHYPTDFEPEAAGEEGLDVPELLSRDLEARMARAPKGVLTEWVRRTREQASDLPLYYTEWNSSPSCTDHFHDEPYAAAFILKTIAGNDGLVDAYSYWTFSDIFEEVGLRSRPFHGGFGLLTIHGIEKPAYQAYRFLHELGGERLPVVGSGEPVEAMATIDVSSLQVLLWNCDVPGSDLPAARVRLLAANAGNPLRATVERVDEHHANPRAAWENMASPGYLTAAQVDELKDAATPQVEGLEVEQDEDGQAVTHDMPPWSIARVVLSAAGA